MAPGDPEAYAQGLAMRLAHYLAIGSWEAVPALARHEQRLTGCGVAYDDAFFVGDERSKRREERAAARLLSRIRAQTPRPSGVGHATEDAAKDVPAVALRGFDYVAVIVAVFC